MSNLSILFHFTLNSQITAISIYLPLIISLFLAVIRPILQKSLLLSLSSLLLLFYICFIWYFRYLYEYILFPNTIPFSDYDLKRIWFFTPGVLLSGLIGILYAQKTVYYLKYFLVALACISTLSSILYVSTYDSQTIIVRLNDESGLVSGILGGFGIAVVLSLLLIRKNDNKQFQYFKNVIAMLSIGIHSAAILLSGTRAALLVAIISIIIYFGRELNKRNVISMILFIALLIFLTYNGNKVIKTFLPIAAIDRIMGMETGVLLRSNLYIAIVKEIIENPFGKIHGYYDVLGMDYSHNTIFQYIAEAGILLSMPGLVIIIYLILRKVLLFRKNLYLKTIGLVGFAVFIQSCSSGSGYDPIVWFIIFYIISFKLYPQNTYLKTNK